MAIRKNERRTSAIEYENTYTKVYAYISNKVKGLPRRYMHYLGEPTHRTLNEIYEDVMRCTDLYLHDKGRSAERYRLCTKILGDIETLINLSYTWWNLSADEKNDIKFVTAKQRTYWSSRINLEMKLISGVMNRCNKGKSKEVVFAEMRPYTKADIKGVIFLEKLAELQKVIYRRAIAMGNEYRDAQMEMLVKLSRDALYNALEGNAVMAEDEKSYKRRDRYMSEAVNCLYMMNRPVRELTFADIFSEKELETICELVTDTTKILKAIRKSDRERFKAA